MAPAEKKSDDSPKRETTIIIIIMVIIIIVGIVIAIPIVYVTGRQPPVVTDPSLALIPADYLTSECKESLNIQPLLYLNNQDPFPYKYYNAIYRPSVIAKQMSIFFGFRHDKQSWSIDKIAVNDTTTGDNLFVDGDFESNYLTQSYTRCILSNTRSSTGDILFDLPYSLDFYYNDQTNVGMTFLSQTIPVSGGRYYNFTFYLENRGYPNNTFLLLVGT